MKFISPTLTFSLSLAVVLLPSLALSEGAFSDTTKREVDSLPRESTWRSICDYDSRLYADTQYCRYCSGVENGWGGGGRRNVRPMGLPSRRLKILQSHWLKW